jgi:hypothetical protein
MSGIAPALRGGAMSVALALSLAVLGCARPAPVQRPATTRALQPPTAAPWPEADALFHRDPRWLGGDAAVSVALDGERVLWLFGDSFIAARAQPGQPPASRRGAAFVRNSVGLQHGLDPSRAALHFYWRTAADGAPGSFFPEQDGCWRWPGHGLLLDSALTIFLMHVCPDTAGAGGLGFRVAGWTAVRVADASGEPAAWQLTPLATPVARALSTVGAAVLLHGEHVYAYGVRDAGDSGDHAVLLLRWRRADFARGDLMRPEYFGGAERGFGEHDPALVIEAGASELSVSPRPRGGYVAVHSRGFGAAPITLRWAEQLTGPFGPPRDVYLPEEARERGVLVYAGRAHPELTGADLVLTYASNTLDAEALLDDLSLYFPRFVRLSF